MDNTVLVLGIKNDNGDGYSEIKLFDNMEPLQDYIESVLGVTDEMLDDDIEDRPHFDIWEEKIINSDN